jgi:putative hydrolase of the HAD superfamily
VPELENIVSRLGIGSLMDYVLSSAITGFEKPHPRAFEIARERAGAPAIVWMVGDNPVVDVEGAEECGIPAILARNQDSRAQRTAAGLDKIIEYVEAGPEDVTDAGA